MKYKMIQTNNGYLVKDSYNGKVVSIHLNREDAEDTLDYLNDGYDNEDIKTFRNNERSER